MKKKILIALGILIVLGIVGVVLVFTNLDKIVRVATEKVMAFVLQVDVTVGAADVQITKGAVEFSDIVIPNPPGFKTDRAMKFGLVRAEVNIPSFRGDEPTINLIRVSEAEITLEAKKGGSNLQVLMDNASRLTGGEGQPPPEEKPAEEPPAEAQKSYKIDKVLVDGTTVRVAIPYMGGETLNVDMPTVEMSDLGGKKEEGGSGGVTAAEGMQEFLAALLGSIQTAGADILPTEVLADIGNSLKALPGQVQESVKAATSAVGESLNQATKDAGTAVKDAGTAVKDAAGEGIKGILGTKKEPTPAP